MKTFKLSLVLRTRENTDVFITLDDNIYGIHSKRVNILYLFYLPASCFTVYSINQISDLIYQIFYIIYKISDILYQISYIK